MTRLLAVTVDVVPVAQPRQRHALVAGRVRNYVPADHPVNAYKAHLRLAVQEAARRQGLQLPREGPLMLTVRFYLPRPKRLDRRGCPEGPVLHTGRPDLDNLWKATVDALNGLVWLDDRQLCATEMDKWYHERGGRPRVELAVYAVDDPELVATILCGGAEPGRVAD